MKEYENALGFWNEFFSMKEPDEIKEWELGSKTVEAALDRFCSDKKMILDFGCGSGWAAHFFSCKGGAKVLGVDQSVNAIELAKKTAKLNRYKNIKFMMRDERYLAKLPSGGIDGIFSNNVLDVIPTTITMRVLAEFRRILKKDAELLIILNFYLTPEMAQKLSMDDLGGNRYALNGNLRAVNYSGQDWRDIFSGFFEVLDFCTFSYDWDKAGVERRLFLLKNKA